MGEPIFSKAVKDGRNFDIGSYPDDKYIRCSRCGWINNLEREQTAPDGSYLGWGTSFSVVTSTSGGSGFGTHSPVDAGVQTEAPGGVIMYSSSNGPSDVLSNSFGSFSFGLTSNSYGNQILLNGASSATNGVMMLLFNSNIYTINNKSQWYAYNGSWALTGGDPRLPLNPNFQTSLLPLGLDLVGQNPYYATTMDAVVGAGCSNCGTLLYNK